MNTTLSRLFMVALIFISTNTHADDGLELETTIIKSNKEAPQILYMVPWRESEKNSNKTSQKLVLHSLFGDLFEPILPNELINITKEVNNE